MKYLLMFVWLVAGVAVAQPQVLVEGLVKPWGLTELPDGRVLITEREGQLRIISLRAESGNLRVTSSTKVAVAPDELLELGQGGLLDVRPHPNFANNQKLYFSYSCGSVAANHTCLAAGVLASTDVQELQPLFRSQPAKAGGAHFAGRLLWLPDHTLLLTVGDGFDYREQAQRLDSHLGKTLRLTDKGGAPTDNPLVGQAAAKAEIFTYGHRNSQGLVWNSTTNNILSHEHGPRGGDEVNQLVAGNNYGWPIATFGLDYTGAVVSPYQRLPQVTPPLLQWTPSIAPSAMAIYQDKLLVTALASRELKIIQLPGASHQAPPAKLSWSEQGEKSLLSEMDIRWRNILVTQSGHVLALSDGADASLYDITAVIVAP
ncbi:MAG: PQQ-dependent sugar dehydrogenase [Idiomarina sp.]